MALKLKKNYKHYLFLIPLGLFIIDYLMIRFNIINPLDEKVFLFLRAWENKTLTNVVILVTHIGGLWLIIAVIALFLILKFKVGLVLGLASLFTQGLNRIIKTLIQRPRPDVLHLVSVSHYSFPSGHAMAITCLYGLLIYFLSCSQIKYKWGLISLAGIIIILVSLSRVYLGVHYFSDIIGGILLSISIILFIVYNLLS